MAKTLWSCSTFLCLIILEVTHVLTVAKPADRTCVIGAGYSGLAAARYLKEYGVNYTVFEATRHVGGTWRFHPHVGTDEDGLPLFTSMYKYLRTNTPRQTMEYNKFPFPENTPAYPSGSCFYKYLKHFTKHYDLSKNIQFRSYVTSVKWAGDHWNLTYLNTETRKNNTERCDFVIIANGQYSTPVWPKFEGQNLFKGKMIHSRDYKEPEPYTNRRVLLVGAGASGLDLSMHLSKLAAKLVHSHHLKFNQPEYPKSYIKKPDIKSFTTNGVIFQDGSFEEVDDVIFCTGYDFGHKFLDENCGVTATGKFVLPLYQHTVNIRHPTMTFVGVVHGVINKVLEAQAQYSAGLAAGKFELPYQERMLKIWLDLVYSQQRKGMKIVNVNTVGDEMNNYFANLTAEGHVDKVPPVLKDIRDFNAKNRLDDLFHYRDYDYKLVDDYHYERWYNPRKGEPCPLNDF